MNKQRVIQAAVALLLAAGLVWLVWLLWGPIPGQRIEEGPEYRRWWRPEGETAPPIKPDYR